MPIYSRKNQYRGINAHLQSYLQHHGNRWESFHTEHIGDLRRAIDERLPDGYFVLNEQSLQLLEIPNWLEPRGHRRTKLDVGLYQERAATIDSSYGQTADNPTGVLTVADTLPEDDYAQSIVIYQQAEADELRPITRIELLSPAHKPPGSHANTYRVKRGDTLKSGVNLVELDYLHERRSPIAALSLYPDERDSFPYLILISNPHPSTEEGLAEIYGFHVDDSVPTVAIPLANGDSIAFQFGAVYNDTFTHNRLYWQSAVDYAQEPERIETYGEVDRERIQQRMAAVQAAHARGDNLDEGPFPLESAE